MQLLSSVCRTRRSYRIKNNLLRYYLLLFLSWMSYDYVLPFLPYPPFLPFVSVFFYLRTTKMSDNSTSRWSRYCPEGPWEHEVRFSDCPECPFCHQLNTKYKKSMSFPRARTPPLPRVRSTPLIEIPDDSPSTSIPGSRAMGGGRTTFPPYPTRRRFETYDTNPVIAAQHGSLARTKVREQSFQRPHQNTSSREIKKEKTGVTTPKHLCCVYFYTLNFTWSVVNQMESKIFTSSNLHGKSSSIYIGTKLILE